MEVAEQQWEQEWEEELEETALLERRPRHQTNGNGNGKSDHRDNNNNGDSLGSPPPGNGVDALGVPEQHPDDGDELTAGKNGIVVDDLVDEEKGAKDGQERSENCVYYDSDKGTGFSYGLAATEHSRFESSAPEDNSGDDRLDVTIQSFDIGKSSSTVINHQYEVALKHDNLLDSDLRPSENSGDDRLDVTIQSFDIGKNSSTVINHQYEVALKHDNLLDSDLRPSENSGDDRLDVTIQSFDIGKSSSTVINHQYEVALKHDNLLDSDLRPSENSGDDRLDVTIQSFDIGKSSSTVINHQYEVALKHDNLLDSDHRPSENSGDDRLDVTIQSFDIGKSSSTVISHQYEEALKHDNLPDCDLWPSEISVGACSTTNKAFASTEIESAEINLTRESDQDVTEFDVERVLEKQNTHDLYCPNCNSCITRRVIIRKRKRRIRTSGEDAKRNKLETLANSKLDAISEHATNNQARNTDDILESNVPPAANDFDRDREPDVFRCLSCFSIFIPTGNGFKLFRMFGSKSEKENLQDPQQIPPRKENWLTSDAGTGNRADVVENNVGVPILSSNLNEQNGLEKNSVGAPSRSSNWNEQYGQTSPAEAFIAVGLINGKVIGENVLASSAQEPAKPGQVMAAGGEQSEDAIEKSKDHSELDTANQLNSASSLTEIPHNHESDNPETKFPGKTAISMGEPLEEADTTHSQDGLKLFIPSNVGTSIMGNLQTGQKLNVAIQKNGADGMETFLLLAKQVPVLEESDMDGKVNISAFIAHDNEQTVGAALLTESAIKIENGNLGIDKDGAYPSEVSQHSIIKTKVDILGQESLKVDTDALISSVQDASLSQDRPVDIGNGLKDMPAERVTGKDTKIVVDGGQVTQAKSTRAEYKIVPEETGASPQIETRISVVEPTVATARYVRRLDIIKSIVYGGLIESIASLCVVSSAAGGDAATLNVLALGLANLIGGLLVIFHDLWDLKNDHTRRTSYQIAEHVDRYQELLGRRSDFSLHAVVAVLSFLIFGLVPPVVYGFSFRKSDDKELKLLVVAAAALLCITVLAAGKAYVRRPPKLYFKTVGNYFTLGLMVSGVSYAVGILIKKLLEKLGLFESSLGVTLPQPMQPAAWASY
ncbi:hypothetical protein RJ640_028352 [Escallonia rubra]|uniref:Membrane protein of ER body-like protein n=1 Tax=Escallonia rubra TaxID=112253 RepID=A0AA88U6B8_9ASTE|nr:hypothetical protein RJ640_028352 [Escallonia rubra]